MSDYDPRLQNESTYEATRRLNLAKKTQEDKIAMLQLNIQQIDRDLEQLHREFNRTREDKLFPS